MSSYQSKKTVQGENVVARKKREAVNFWDGLASDQCRKGNILPCVGAWVAKQLAKGAPESPVGLAGDLLTFGSGGLLVKGATRGVQALKATRLAQQSARAIQLLGAAEKLVPKFNQYLRLTNGTKLVTPRRALKAVTVTTRGLLSSPAKPSQQGARLAVPPLVSQLGRQLPQPGSTIRGSAKPVAKPLSQLQLIGRALGPSKPLNQLQLIGQALSRTPKSPTVRRPGPLWVPTLKPGLIRGLPTRHLPPGKTPSPDKVQLRPVHANRVRTTPAFRPAVSPRRPTSATYRPTISPVRRPVSFRPPMQPFMRHARGR
jgi:hypothetical protein